MRRAARGDHPGRLAIRDPNWSSAQVLLQGAGSEFTTVKAREHIWSTRTAPSVSEGWRMPTRSPWWTARRTEATRPPTGDLERQGKAGGRRDKASARRIHLDSPEGVDQSLHQGRLWYRLRTPDVEGDSGEAPPDQHGSADSAPISKSDADNWNGAQPAPVMAREVMPPSTKRRSREHNGCR